MRVTFLDKGIGIPEKLLAKVMTPFITTKPAGIGTGLGLSISYEIVNRHGGTIEIESEHENYTKVITTFPAITDDQRLEGQQIAAGTL